VKHLTGITRTLISILLLLIIIASFSYFGWRKIAFIIASCSFVLFLFSIICFYLLKRRKYNLYRELYHAMAFKKVLITGVKHAKNRLVLQLQISENDQGYISHLIISKPNQDEIDNYKQGTIIDVCINPKDKHDIFMPDQRMEAMGKIRINWLAIYMPLLFIGLFLGPEIVRNLNASAREFKSSIFIENGNGQQNIWELRYESPKIIYLSIYDPVKGTIIKTIKDKKPKDLNIDDFFISQQGENIVLVGIGLTPVFDIYDAKSFQKISGIEEFEQNNEILNMGIARFNSAMIGTSKFLNEIIIKILTNKGELYYYNINQNKFYFSEDEVKRNIYQSDSTLMGQHMYAFALSYNRVYADRKQYLYYFESSNIKGLNELISFAGRDDFEIGLFDQGSHYVNKYSKCSLLLNDEYFYAKILYFDFEIVVLQYAKTLDLNADLYITGFDRSGKRIFDLIQSDFPNVDDMIDKTRIDLVYLGHITRKKDNLIILFKQFGAICINLKTGKQVWKFEP
jgi:hypothetical protein